MPESNPPTPYQDTYLIRMPYIIDINVTPGQVSQVRVQQGQQVSPGEILADVDGYQLSGKITSPATGQILQVLVSSGQEIEIGDPMFLLGLSPESSDIP